jgi:hypothetical protein
MKCFLKPLQKILPQIVSLYQSAPALNSMERTLVLPDALVQIVTAKLQAAPW